MLMRLQLLFTKMLISGNIWEIAWRQISALSFLICVVVGDCVFPCIALSWKYSQGIVGTVSLTSHDLKLGTGRDDLPRVACRLGGRAGLELVNFSQAASAVAFGVPGSVLVVRSTLSKNFHCCLFPLTSPKGCTNSMYCRRVWGKIATFTHNFYAFGYL